MAGDREDERVTDYARMGASARLAELRAEIEFIYQRFPQLREGRPEPAATLGARPPTEKPARNKPVWTAAMKKAAADRMKKYWASRRAGGRKPSARD